MHFLLILQEHMDEKRSKKRMNKYKIIMRIWHQESASWIGAMGS